MHHSVGDMFWWIAHGIPGTAMPAFAPRISDASIWTLTQFLRAQSAANDARLLTRSVEPWRPIVAPDFTFEIASRGQESLKDQRGHHVLLVLYTGRKPNRRLFETLQFYLLGWVSDDELDAALAQLPQLEPGTKA